MNDRLDWGHYRPGRITYLPVYRLLLLPVLAGAQALGQSPLNLLFVIDDQHNPRMLGTDSNGYGGLDSTLTPRLDQLAEEGVLFSHSYCSTPQCVPARFTLLTGREPHLHGLRWNKIWEPAFGELTLPELARRHGYVTANIGKHHLAWLDQPGESITDHGFDLVVDLGDYDDHCDANGQRPWNHGGNHWSMDALKAGYTFNTNEFHPAGYFSDRAMQFLDERSGPAGDGLPFLLWLSYYGPHTPILPSGPADPDDWAHRHGPYEDLSLPGNISKVADLARLAKKQAEWSHMSQEEHREALSYYYGLVSQIDHNIGRVLDHLEALELSERTVVVFNSDHGEMAAEMSCWTKGGGMYESLTRVPLIVRTPGSLVQGAVVDSPVTSVDFFPTLTELLGLSPTAAERDRLSGRSFAGQVLLGTSAADWPEVVFSQFGPPGGDRVRMAVSSADKYVQDDRNGGEEEYFDLLADPWEMENLIADPTAAERIGELRGLVEDWWGDESEHAPTYVTTGVYDLPPQTSGEPYPESGATGERLRVDPRWVPATSAETQHVYLGSVAGELELFRVLPAMASSFNPGTLEPGVEYFWRVDGVNQHGVTEGEEWSFTTRLNGRGGPALASLPSPEDGAPSVPLGTVLGWTSGEGSMAHDVWFGPTDGKLEKVIDGAPAARFRPSNLEAGRSYTWRVDGLDSEGRTVGDLWTFVVDGSGLPGHATEPSPAHLEFDVHVPPGKSLSWTGGLGAGAHDVYLGTEFPLTFQGRVVGITSFKPGTLEPGRNYYWRVDEVSSTGTRTGFTWRFTTRE